MSTTQVLIVVVGAVLITAMVALTRWRVREAELAAEDSHDQRQIGAQRSARERDAASLAAVGARRALGPANGAKLGVHVGSHLVRGTRVRRGEPEAEGWIVLDDAELLEGTRATPMGGTQWLRDPQWMQEL